MMLTWLAETCRSLCIWTNFFWYCYYIHSINAWITDYVKFINSQQAKITYPYKNTKYKYPSFVFYLPIGDQMVGQKMYCVYKLIFNVIVCVWWYYYFIYIRPWKFKWKKIML